MRRERFKKGRIFGRERRCKPFPHVTTEALQLNISKLAKLHKLCPLKSNEQKKTLKNSKQSGS